VRRGLAGYPSGARGRRRPYTTDHRADRHPFRVGWLGPAPAQVGRNAITISQPLEVAIEANADNARQLRVRVRQWLCDLDAPRDLIDDLTMAVYEALANVVEHAYHPDHPDPVMRLQAQRDYDQLLITITDYGRWRPPPEEPGYRGRGLAMMRSLTGDVQLHHTAEGTTVRLRAALQQRSDRRVPADPPSLR
jgi:anti-sigma regulatory factor (Ser/Thr protein kinase)